MQCILVYTLIVKGYQGRSLSVKCCNRHVSGIKTSLLRFSKCAILIPQLQCLTSPEENRCDRSQHILLSMSLSLLHSLSVWTLRRDTQAAEEKVLRKGNCT